MIYMAPELVFSSALGSVSRIICTPPLYFILPRLTLASGNQNRPLFLHPPQKSGQGWTLEPVSEPQNWFESPGLSPVSSSILTVRGGYRQGGDNNVRTTTWNEISL